VIHFKPDKLQEAKESVQDDHPFAPNPEVQTDGSLADQKFFRRLRERLKNSSAAEVFALIKDLNDAERRVIGRLTHDPQESVRIRAAQCLKVAPKLARTKNLWRAFNRYFEKETGSIAGHILKQEDDLRESLNEFQSLTIEKSDDLTGLWRSLTLRKIDGKTFRDESDLVQGSQLDKAIGRAFLLGASREVWENQGPHFAAKRFEDAESKTRIETFNHLHELYRETEYEEAINTQTRRVLQKLMSHPRLLTAVGDRFSEAAEWLKKIVDLLKVEEYFGKGDYNERIEFWWEFAPHIVDVRLNNKSERLFLEFENFGAIEFECTGNAAYVYPKRKFQAERLKDEKDPWLANGELKDQDRVKIRIEHHSNWQSKYRQKIQQFIQRG
jgi:hypothetical protein